MFIKKLKQTNKTVTLQKNRASCDSFLKQQTPLPPALLTLNTIYITLFFKLLPQKRYKNFSIHFRLVIFCNDFEKNLLFMSGFV